VNLGATGRTVQLLLLTLAAASVNYAQFIVSPLQEAMRVALGLNDNLIAVLQGPAMALPLALASIPLGILIDRHARTRLIRGFVFLALSGSLLTAWASDFVLLFLSRCLVGLAVPAVAFAAISMIADLYTPAQRGRALMVVAIGQVGAMSGAFALGGVLLASMHHGSNGWRWALLWLTMPLVGIMILAFFLREPQRTGVAVQKPSPRAAVTELWRYRAVLAPLVAGTAMVSVVDTATLIWAAPTLSRNFLLSADRVGSIMAIALLVNGIAGPVAGGLLADFCQRTGGPRRTVWVLSGLVLLSAPAGSFGMMRSLTATTVGLVVFLAVGNAINVMIAPLVTVIIPNELRGLSMATLSAVSGPLCLGLAPPAVSLLSQVTGGPATIGQALALVCIAFSLVGAATLAWGSRHFSQMIP